MQSRVNETNLQQQSAILMGAKFLSSAGTSFGRIALAFSILGNSDLGSIALSIILVAQVVPQIAGALWGGFAGDRFPRRTVIVAGDFAAGCAWIGLWFAATSESPSVLWMSLLAGASGLATVAASPALTAIVPDIFSAEEEILRRTNSRIRAASSMGLTTGLAGGAALIAHWGPEIGIALNAISYFVAGALGLLLRPAMTLVGNSARLIPMLRDGFGEFRARPWIWIVVLQSSFYVAAVNANVGVLGPLSASEFYNGAVTWSQLMLAQAGGGIVGAGIAGRLLVRRPLVVAVGTAMFGAVACALLGMGSPFLLVLLSFFLVGIGMDVFGVLWETSLQSSLDRRVLARIASWDLVGSLALAPIGLALAGPVAEAVGVRHAQLLAASVIGAVTIAALFSRSVRRFELPGARSNFAGDVNECDSRDAADVHAG